MTIETSPPRRFRIVHKPTGKAAFFEITVTHLGPRIVNQDWSEFEGSKFKMADFALPDQSTGYTDSEDIKVFGGDLMKYTFLDRCNSDRIERNEYAIIVWNRDSRSFLAHHLEDGSEISITGYARHHTVIGNIHNIAALPEEVRRMVEEVR